MQYPLTPYTGKIEHFAWWENAFNDEELDLLQEKAKQANQIAQVGGGPGVVREHVRRSTLQWVNNAEDTKWIFHKLAHIVSDLNANFFRFDLTGFGEPIQLTNYDQSVQGMYGWHVDFGNPGASRKLSLVMQLSHPHEYEGGILEIKTHDDNPIQIKKQRGFIAVFPSWTLHQVTPVTRGSRQSLVSWVTGPMFK